jgi:hypothetical protein
MKAIVRNTYGSPDVLELQELEKPDLADDGVLVRVRNDTDRSAVTLVIYAGAGNLEEAGYEEHPRQFDQA